MTRPRAARAVLAILIATFATFATACRPEAPPAAPVATPGPPAPPALSAAGPAERLEDGRIAYPVVVRSESGVVFIPLSLSATNGDGATAWFRSTPGTWAYDAAADRYVPRPAEEGGAALDEHVDAIFPASPQRLTVKVAYAGPAPAEEELVLAYRTVAIADLARSAYVPPALAGRGADAATEGLPRAPLGERIRSVEVARWLAAGFFLREPGPAREVRIRVPGPEAAR